MMFFFSAVPAPKVVMMCSMALPIDMILTSRYCLLMMLPTLVFKTYTRSYEHPPKDHKETAIALHDNEAEAVLILRSSDSVYL